MNSDSPELATARENLDKAVKAFVAAHAAQREVEGETYVVAWAAYAEYLTTEYVDMDVTGNCIMTPDDQHATTSRGVFEFGADAFRRSVT